jgi:diguanylate cyclase (GGDEF)-like protein/PAS domain S-box-containing protein
MPLRGIERLPGAVAAGDPDLWVQLLDALPDVVVVIDGQGLLQWANRAAERLFGASLADHLGASGLELVHPEDLEFVLLSLDSVQHKAVGTPIEVRLRTAGGWRLVELIGAPIPWLDEGAVLLSLRDLTERRRFELAHDHDARFRTLVQNAPMVTMLVSPDGVVESVSGALTRMLGHDPEHVEGRPLTELVDPADHPPVEEWLDRASNGASAANPATVTVGLRRHGQEDLVPFELSVVNLIDDPTVGGYVVTGHDVSDRVAVELELRETLSLLTATLDATADGILVVQGDGRLASFNPRFVEMWGLSDATLEEGDPTTIAFLRDQLASPEAFATRVEEIYADPSGESFDVLSFQDGRVFERISKPQLIDGRVLGRVWSFRDVTDRKRLEDRLSYQAYHDPLTGLGNRALFQDRLELALGRTVADQRPLAVLFLDVDNFKLVNDSLGHFAGDTLLQSIAEVLVGCLRKHDTAARIGGDEFGIIVEGVTHPDQVVTLASRILDAVREPLIIGPEDVRPTVSIGYTFSGPDLPSDQLLCNADIAMYVAKARGKNQYAEFDGPSPQATAAG